MEKNFEDSLNELEKIIKELENGDVALDDAIKKYTTAMNLVKNCNEKLQDATDKVNKILTENNELQDFTLEGESNETE